MVTLEGHSFTFKSVQFSRSSPAVLVSMALGLEIRSVISGYAGGSLIHVQFSRSGPAVLVSMASGFEIRSIISVVTLEGHSFTFRSVQFSRSSPAVLVNMVFRITRNKEFLSVVRLAGHSFTFRSVQFSRSGQFIIDLQCC